MTNEFHHITVLLHETVDQLAVASDGIYVDATLGALVTASTIFEPVFGRRRASLCLLIRPDGLLTMLKSIWLLMSGDGDLIKDNFRHSRAVCKKPVWKKLMGLLAI